MKILEELHRLVYYIIIVVLTFDSAVRNSQVLYPIYQSIESIIPIFMLILAFLVILTGKIRQNKLILAAVMFFLGSVIFLRLGRTFFIYFTLVIIFAPGKDLDTVARLMLKIMGGVFGFNVLSTIYFFIFDHSSLYVRRALNEPRPQLDLSCGGHPNHAACFYVFILCLIVYLYWDKLTFKFWILTSLLCGIVYFLIGSVAVFLVAVLLLVWVFRKNSAFIKIAAKAIKCGIPIIIFISLISVWAKYVPGGLLIDKWLNVMSSGRFQLSMKVLDYYALTFLGADTEFGHFMVNFNQDLYLYADNAYIYMLVNSGAIYLFILWGIFYRAADVLKVDEVAICIVYLCYGLAESNILSFTCLFPVIVAVYARERKLSISLLKQNF